jgi:uroporphyrinogen-III decarboxylase
MWGGVDKRSLAVGRDAIEKELERVKPLIAEGGYLPMLDHSATPDTPYENYRYFLERLKTFL